MTKEHTETFIDHEVRIRLTEELVKNVRTDLVELRKDIKLEMEGIRKDMHSQFLWTIGTILTLFGGVILHMAKLI